MCFKFAFYSIQKICVIDRKQSDICVIGFLLEILQYSTLPYLFSLLLLFVGSEEGSVSPCEVAKTIGHWAQLPTATVKRQRSRSVMTAARGIALHCEIDELVVWQYLAHTLQPNTPACPRTHILRDRNTTAQLLRQSAGRLRATDARSSTGRLRAVRSYCKM